MRKAIYDIPDKYSGTAPKDASSEIIIVEKHYVFLGMIYKTETVKVQMEAYSDSNYPYVDEWSDVLDSENWSWHMTKEIK